MGRWWCWMVTNIHEFGEDSSCSTEFRSWLGLIIIDSSILVPILRKKPAGLHQAQQLVNESIATTTISAFELFFGAQSSQKREENLKAVEELVQTFPVYPLSIEAAFIAGKVQHALITRGEKIELNDAYIASIVLSLDGILATNNPKHFERIDGLKLYQFPD